MSVFDMMYHNGMKFTKIRGNCRKRRKRWTAFNRLRRQSNNALWWTR